MSCAPQTGEPMKFARVNQVVLHYEVAGDDAAPPLVFSNSLGTDFRIWDHVVDRLKDRYRIIRYDKRGHGLSEATPAPYRLSDHIDDLEALLAYLRIERTAIVGLSVGGMIAQGLAARRPELFAALVLADTGHRVGTPARWNERIDAVNKGGIAAIAEGVLKLWFTPAFRSPDNPDFAGYQAMLTRTDISGYVGTCAALREADLTETTRALRLPVLCLVGDQDGSTPPDLVRSLADLIPGAEFKIIAGAGHLPNVEQPEAFADLVSAFLEAARYSSVH